ncbi:KilA-N domain-containing protein [Noviherbaspirillum denitrificans]|uniref:DNA-binding protein n=1 Tax=Noviherbaspirillum denitrificans TaxID=1968433 RepID=A0A254TF74_9BURK|nr:KilA-N domain-containing protein [Noviherbaspirillum denitrificans]OWW19203.1 DNA-binding protein [Noviherbaspirillum denitrificans]
MAIKKQMDLDLIHHEENGAVIDQRAGDGYINATALCQAAGRKFSHYIENKATTAFLAALESDAGIPASVLVQSVKGGHAAHQGTWVHPQVAVNLGQWLSATFAVKVSKWVYDWMSGKGVPEASRRVPYHIERHMANQHKIPLTSFSILQEMSITLIGPLEAHGYSLPEKMVPDISQGRMFCDFLRKNGLADPATLPTYRHSFPDGREVDAKLYPIELLPAFRKFIAETWMPKKAEQYFLDRDPAALPYLAKVLRLEAPTPANAPNFKRIA